MSEDPHWKEEYFKNNAMPYLIEHMKMRSTGLQLFTAIQAGLLAAWAHKTDWSFSVLGIASCVSFFLWDERNRYIFQSLHRLGMAILEKYPPVERDGGPAGTGMHRFFVGTLAKSGWCPLTLKKGSYMSHTCAIRIMLLIAFVLWLVLFVRSPKVWDMHAEGRSTAPQETTQAGPATTPTPSRTPGTGSHSRATPSQTTPRPGQTRPTATP